MMRPSSKMHLEPKKPARFPQIPWRRFRSLSILALASGLLPQGSFAAGAWIESSFEDFKDGTFGDAGANVYVSAKGRIQTINRWDVNGDGYIDILCVNSHPLIEMLDMSIYWGNGKDFSIERHTYVPADGPMRVAPGDLDGDGRTDLVVANFSNGTWTSMDSAVYWGGLETLKLKPRVEKWDAYPFAGRTLLPGRNAQGVAIGDFNRDGHPDIVFAFSAGYWEYRGGKGPLPARIYWNSGGGFDRENYTELEIRGATDVAVADFNNDGWLDLAFSNGNGDRSFVLPGGADGFSGALPMELPTAEAQAALFADLDNDGALDALFVNEEGEASYAYLNRDGKFDPSRRIEFETYGAKAAAVADFNRDGFEDVFFANHQFSLTGEKRFGNRMIDSYLYFGSKSGFSKENRLGIQTIGAWGANAADLNEDGWVDLLVCNFQGHYSYEVPSFIYWNGPDGFDVTRRTPLYEHGARGNAIADFNGDGHLDILITSMMGGSRGDYDPSYLYLGNREGHYGTGQRLLLPGREPYEQAMADLDDDGRVEVLLMNQGEVARYENELWIYWNKDNTFDPWRITGLPAYAGVGVETADLDRDGYLDVIIANNRNYPAPLERDPAPSGPGNFPDARPGSFIYWGGAGGWTVTERTVLNVARARSPSIADLDGDGHLDLVFAGPGASIFYGDGTRDYSDARRQPLRGTLGLPSHQTEVADLNRDGFLDIVFAGPKVIIFYGNEAHSYSAAERTLLDLQAKTMNIADVNGDGWLDLLCPLYKEKGRRSLLSSVLLGGPGGFSLERRILLPTDGGTGGIVSDFNFDGYNDIFFFCHRKDGSPDVVGEYGDHHTNSRLYWGGADGFNPSRYLPIPSVGAHYDVGVDLGHIVDRTFQWDYISSPHDTAGRKPTRLTWKADTPARTSLKFQIRIARAEAALEAAEWLGPGGADTFFTRNNSDLSGLPAGQWMQYRAVLDTGNGAASPVLDTVAIKFE